MTSFIRLDPADNVAVTLREIRHGETVDGLGARNDVPSGHKIATDGIAAGDPILKFGQVIGIATVAISPGDHVHTQNCAMAAPISRAGAARGWRSIQPTRTAFDGYLRPDGRAGTRNYIAVMASVNCSTTVCRAIADAANRELLPRFPGVDGFFPLIHDQGCGLAGSGENFEQLVRTLKGYRDHPNLGGTLIVGLGCEVNQLTLYQQTGWRGERLASFNIQAVGGSRSAVKRALEILEPIAARADTDQRQTLPVSHLVLGMQCGGSDGFSGITANPALGIASDLLVAAGGSSILSETPEIYGAEHLLQARAGPDTAERIVDLVTWWRDYAKAGGATLDNNPSPGNKAGGLTTILEKALGATAKSGHAPVSAAIGYAEPVPGPGLIFMDSPGYDPVSVTGQIASGANLIAFTTGRGSCFGAKPVPTLKLASTTSLAQRMPEDMDIDCGPIATGAASVREIGDAIYDALLDMASGLRTKSEEFGYGDNEFLPWKIGAVL